jgi:hypothetical protein
MYKRKLLLGLACAAVAAVVVAPSVGAGAKTECNAVYSNTTLKGGVVVNSGDVCVLDNVKVNGGLTVNGGLILVTDSRINGGWSITGDVFELGYLCGNNVNGGLNVSGVTTPTTLAFGEANANCAGGRINGGATFTGNPAAFVELDSYAVNGGVTFAGNGGGELEGTVVHGSASCDAGIFNDGDGGPNTYTGPNAGCPA